MSNVTLLSLYDTCLAVVNNGSFESNERFKLLPTDIKENLAALKADKCFRVNPPYNALMFQRFGEQLLLIHSMINISNDRDTKIELVKQLFNCHCSNIIHLKYIRELRKQCLLRLESLQQEGFPKEDAQKYISIISSI